MIRTKLPNLHISPITLHSASSVRIPSSVNNFHNMLPTIRLSPLGSPIIRTYTKQLKCSKDTECVLIILSAMSVAHIYVII